MPSPRTKPAPLSDTEIQQIATEIAAGRPPMVWFTSAAVGVQEGRSGKVVALGDPADGDFLQVRPTGSKDVLSFSPVEVTLAKPPRPATTPRRGARTSGDNASHEAEQTAKPAPPSEQDARPTQTTSRKDDPPVTQPSTVTSVPAPAAETADPAKATAPKTPATPAAPKPAKAPGAAAARKSRTPEVTITLTGTADGEWSVDVVNGKKRTIRGLAVGSASVGQAAKVLHPEVAEVVAGILEAVRGAQEARVAQLQAELAEARKLLEELSD